jgi:hypothetical protein
MNDAVRGDFERLRARRRQQGGVDEPPVIRLEPHEDVPAPPVSPPPVPPRERDGVRRTLRMRLGRLKG